MKTKNQWASKLGFIMATAGAAIGLGNLWKFPYLMGRNGGASFLVVYLFFICILGVPVMMKFARYVENRLIESELI